MVNNQLISRPLRAYVGAVVGVLLWGFTWSAQAQSVPGELATAAVESRSLAETVLLDGVIEAVQQSTVSAQTSGKVLQLPFDVDDSVRPGDLIAQLEDSEQRARVSQAQATVNEARAALSDAKQRFARIESVH